MSYNHIISQFHLKKAHQHLQSEWISMLKNLSVKCEPLILHLLHFCWHECFSNHHLFQWYKNVVITQVGDWQIKWMWKALEVQIHNGFSCCMSSMGLSTVMVQQDTCTQKFVLELLTPQTRCNERHASSYWTFNHWCFLIGFTHSL